MENEEKKSSIFEQEDYDGGFGSGPFTLAPEPDEEDHADPENDDETEARLHASSETELALMTTLMGAYT